VPAVACSLFFFIVCGAPFPRARPRARSAHRTRSDPRRNPNPSTHTHTHTQTHMHSSIPDGAARCRHEWGIVRQTWARRADLPSGEAGMYALFAGELFAWACVGEIVGRGGTFGGYAV